MKNYNALKLLSQKPFQLNEAIGLGLSKYALKNLMDEGVIERISRGIYQRTSASGITDDERYRIANLRCGSPSAICLISALEYYHLTDHISKHVWVLVPESKRSVVRELRLIRSRKPYWNIGIHKTKNYWITTPERTVVDCLIYRRHIGSQVAIEALKKAVTQKKVKLGVVLNMAKRMGVRHRILPYIEALSS